MTKDDCSWYYKIQYRLYYRRLLVQTTLGEIHLKHDGTELDGLSLMWILIVYDWDFKKSVSNNWYASIMVNIQKFQNSNRPSKSGINLFVYQNYKKIEYHLSVFSSACTNIVTEPILVSFLYFYILSHANLQVESTMLVNLGNAHVAKDPNWHGSGFGPFNCSLFYPTFNVQCDNNQDKDRSCEWGLPSLKGGSPWRGGGGGYLLLGREVCKCTLGTIYCLDDPRRNPAWYPV